MSRPALSLHDTLPCSVGWARRGPSGTIGTNRPDGYALAEHLAEALPEAGGKQGRSALDALLAERGVDVVTFRAWQRIEQAEIERARAGSPPEKFHSLYTLPPAPSRHGPNQPQPASNR